MKNKKPFPKFNRLISISTDKSFILFGSVGTGKTKVLNKIFNPQNSVLIDLLEPETYIQCSSNPSIIVNYIESLSPDIKWIVINEFQKIPQILNVVNQCISDHDIKFALTASSKARLDSEAFDLFKKTSSVYQIFPLTHRETADRSVLNFHMRWGSLPGIFNKSDKRKLKYLYYIVKKYTVREVTSEYVIRKPENFEKFLFHAAHSSGTVINCSDLSRKVGVSATNITSFYKILEDTFMGITLDSYLMSVRGKKILSPKFYFADTGIMRFLTYSLKEKFILDPAFIKNMFKHFVINEIYRLLSYLRLDYKLFYLKTDTRQEIDLVIERPGMKNVLIELDPANEVKEDKVKLLDNVSKKFPDYECYFLSFDKMPHTIKNVQCLHWEDGLKEIGLVE